MLFSLMLAVVVTGLVGGTVCLRQAEPTGTAASGQGWRDTGGDGVRAGPAWVQRIEAVGNLRAVEDVDVASESATKAVATRYWSIVMATVAMLMVMIPLLLATGPGSASRMQMGWVNFIGLGIGTLCTLFVVPAVYVLLAWDRRAAVRSHAVRP